MTSEPLIAAPPERPDPPALPERAALEAWLDFHRATLLTKCAGLDAEQLAARSCPPSTLSLLGLVRHLTDVERGWFLRRWVDGIAPLHYSDDDPDGDFDNLDPARAAEDLAAYREAVEAARAEAARHELGERVLRRPDHPAGEVIDVRWIYLHMIEEYARHNGHADLLREAIDGTTGE
jgi:uncharacterized damage-inducible protein DinB